MTSLERRVAVDAARAAGRLLRDELAGVRRISYKGTPTNLVTEMDARAEAMIVGALRTAFPDDAVLAEEGSAFTGGSGRRWIVDPLDGTTNYAHGVPAFAVSIALEDAGRVVLGVLYEPNLDEMFIAERGGGATMNDAPLAVSATARLDASLLTTGFPYDVRVRPDNNLAEYSAFSLRSRGVRRWGSAVIDLAYIAAGRFDGYWERGIRPWDVAAGIVIVREAGGMIGPLDPGADLLEGGGIVAGNAFVHEPLTKLLREA
jgi:myo-inositol-1(or 4)-monophosphatase